MASDPVYPPVALVSIRDNYTIRLTPLQLTQLIAALQELGEGAYPNVTCMIQRISKDQYVIEAVVGTVDPDNIYSGGAGPPTDVDPEMTTSNQNAAFIHILDEMCLDYTVGKAVQTLGIQPEPGTPGTYLRLISALTSAGIPVLSSYDSAVPYVLPPVLCPESVLEYQVGIKGYIFHINDSDTSRAYHVLSGILSAPSHHKGILGSAKKHHHKNRRHRTVDA